MTDLYILIRIGFGNLLKSCYICEEFIFYNLNGSYILEVITIILEATVPVEYIYGLELKIFYTI